MEPEKFAKFHDLRYAGNTLAAGVEFARFIEKDGSETYYYIHNGKVEGPPLSEVGRKGNYTYGVLEESGEKVMVDDVPPFVHLDHPI